MIEIILKNAIKVNFTFIRSLMDLVVLCKFEQEVADSLKKCLLFHLKLTIK